MRAHIAARRTNIIVPRVTRKLHACQGACSYRKLAEERYSDEFQGQFSCCFHNYRLFIHRRVFSYWFLNYRKYLNRKICCKMITTLVSTIDKPLHHNFEISYRIMVFVLNCCSFIRFQYLFSWPPEFQKSSFTQNDCFRQLSTALMLIILRLSCPWYDSSVSDFFCFREMNVPQEEEKNI